MIAGFESRKTKSRSFPSWKASASRMFVGSAVVTGRFGLQGELSQPGAHADLPQKLRKPSTWPYAVHIHKSHFGISGSRSTFQHASEARAILVVDVSNRLQLWANDARARSRGGENLRHGCSSGAEEGY
jgi:hypothetical protein